MDLFKSHTRVIFSTILTILFFISPLSALDDNSKHEFNLRGGLGVGKTLWGYIDHGSSSGDLGSGTGMSLNLNLMYNYSLFAAELSILAVPLNKLEWEDEDISGINHTYTSTGSGNFSVFDIKLGAKLFRDPGDMGYTFLYLGLRSWQAVRDQETVEIDGVSFATTVKREANGRGWLIGFRDFSTIGPDNGFAIAIQTGLWFGKAPVDEMKTDGVVSGLKEKDNLGLGLELGGGVAMQDIGLSVIGGVKFDVNATIFNDPAAPVDEESVFGFGILHFYVEVTKTF